MNGVTTGAPLSVRITNVNHEKWKGKAVEPYTTPRPGHADLTGAIKYGYDDLRFSLERASARETAARVGVGAVCKRLLHHFGIEVFGYVTAIGEVESNLDNVPLEERGPLAEVSEVRCPDHASSKAMQERMTVLARFGSSCPVIMGPQDCLSGLCITSLEFWCRD